MLTIAHKRNMISDHRIKAEMDKKKDKDQNWLEHNFAMAKIEFSK